MSLSTRVQQLERRSGIETSSKHFLFVRWQTGETEEQAYLRTLAEKSLSSEQVGYILFLGGSFGWWELRLDEKTPVEKMRGHLDFTRWLHDFLDKINGKSMGPPGLRAKVA